MEKQQIIDYVLDSPENTNPAILGQMIDEVGGSGEESSDFSTCIGTFIADSTTRSYGLQAYDVSFIENNNIKSINGNIPSDGEYNILLYKGKQLIYMSGIRQEDLVSIDGNIEDKGDGYYEITGDFTVHFILYLPG